MKKNLFKTILLLALACAVSVVASAQTAGQKVVSGTVVDENGVPVPGASVLVKGTTTGVSTDIDGNFSFTVPDNAVLEISSIGFVGQEVNVAGKSTLAITIKTIPNSSTMSWSSVTVLPRSVITSVLSAPSSLRTSAS